MSDFWSRRKQGVAREARRTRDAEAEALAAEDRANLEDLPDAEALARLELPDPDTLAPGDDFARFLAREVPERIRRRALRALWRSNPVLANVDGLVDHGEDYTDAATVPAVLKTTYEVGKGLAAHVRRMNEALERVGDGPAVEPADASRPAYPVAVVPPERTVREARAAASAETPAEIVAEPAARSETDPPSGQPEQAAAEPHVPAPRARMRFSFDAEETAA